MKLPDVFPPDPGVDPYHPRFERNRPSWAPLRTTAQIAADEPTTRPPVRNNVDAWA